ncbi:hypothetical protein CA13_02750 [Planctomycetes bacterium CA13]|uniref:Uncharacterized protein n=1 Tax=Novipirellula herctigrandis TaxID=2527986 RepID=A0A5C5YV45_9BACT|nr:hypothetical protein CA13_02750 [Planctomycetes bacterium CA13]
MLQQQEPVIGGEPFAAVKAFGGSEGYLENIADSTCGESPHVGQAGAFAIRVMTPSCSEF